MSNDITRDEIKLPKWAQTRLMVLRAQVEVFSGQLAQQADLLGLALEIIEKVDVTPAYDGRGDCCYCGRRVRHDEDCERVKAERLVPDLEKALEKVK